MAQKKIITGIQKISEYYNQKKDIRIYLLSDLHQKPFHCGRKSMKASDYILEQVELSPHEQIDLFVETAYLSNKKDTKWYRSVPKSPSPYVCGNEMKWLVSSLADCFTPGKESEFTNLRCHNVDLRDLRLHPNLKFLNILYILANAKFVYENAKHDQFNATHKRLAAHLLEERLIKKDGRIPSFSPDYIRDIKRQLKTFHSSQEAMYKLVQIEFRKTHTSHLSLFTSQLIHIPDIKVRKVIAETANKWIYIRSKNPFLRWKTLKKGLRAIINGKKTILFEERVYKTKDFLYRCFSAYAKWMGIIMDLYTIARIFRSYPSKNNRPSVDYARNIIVFAGGGHINQYTPVLKELGFRLIKESINPRGCVDISKFKSPWFSKRISPKNTHTYFTYDEPDEREIIMSNYKSTKFKGKHKKFKIRSQKRTRKELAKNSQRSRQAKAFKN